ncbi:MAG: hypothetical protein R3D26_23985 [Cyanobacteriota/Melainabacteria group bacterium]
MNHVLSAHGGASGGGNARTFPDMAEYCASAFVLSLSRWIVRGGATVVYIGAVISQYQSIFIWSGAGNRVEILTDGVFMVRCRLSTGYNCLRC